MVKQLQRLFWLPLALLLVAFQTDAVASVCEQVIRTAMAATETTCSGLGRNQACYGNHLLEAFPQAGVDDFNFDDIGDVIDISGIERLRLSAMNMDAGLWGVALMRLQANIPHQLETENVTMVLFGDVEVRNEVAAPHLVAMRPALQSNVNVRRYPERDAYVLGTIQPGEIALADGQLEDSSWYHVQLLSTGEKGWVFAGSVESVGSATNLRIVDVLSAEFGPMQAFYLRTGETLETPGCAEAPENGVLIQTPEGVATVDLWINEVKIRLGSTAFVQAQGGGDMTIRLVEGATEVSALGVDQVAVAGTELTVPMTNSLQPAAPPSLPQSYTQASVAAIPVQALERPVEVAPPLDQNTLNALNDANRADVETPTPVPPTNTATPIPTNTPLPTATPRPTNTPVPPTVTPIPPTNTPVPPTATPVPPTATPIPPTDTPVPPTNTPLPPMDTPIPPPTNTLLPPTDTQTP
jgi:hypothetical protein